MITPKPVIFTDLDGTLLDRDTYSFEAAEPALRLIREKGIPLILSSSKTRGEIESYRRRLGNHHPFISENGGGIFIPKGYFSFPFPYDKEGSEYFILELGTSYPTLVEVLETLRKESGVKIIGFSDLSDEEIGALTGLGLEESRLAKQREYDEPFIMEGGEEEIEAVKKKIKERGFHYAWGGRFHHIFGRNDKGKAVQILKTLYENEYFSVFTIGIGDSLNDLPMLLAVEEPIFLQREKKQTPLKVPNLTLINGSGPRAWNEAILRVLLTRNGSVSFL